ncbi:unnamed protein product [Phytomonas sp. EM1]|nr:unnamed protein product [Phytomonas sp. EM1]|eukprot:CCW61205.1 unnamed protein product [Phytomonas sp. isolate EM1]
MTPKNLLSATSRVLELCQTPFNAQINFITANRVVAVLEKAVQRLQLLALLDESAPGGDVPINKHEADSLSGVGADQETAVPNGTSKISIYSHSGGVESMTALRGAALFTRSGQQIDGAAAMHSTYSAVSAALAESAKDTYRGRPTVAELLKEQQQLEVRYEGFLRASRLMTPSTEASLRTKQIFGRTGEFERDELQHELMRVSAKLREHRRVLCTQLKDNPNDVDNWRKISNEREELITLLKDTITELTTGYQESTRYSSQRGGIHQTGLGMGTFSNSCQQLPSLCRSMSGTSMRSFGNIQGALKDDLSEAPPSRLSHTNTLHSTLSKRFGSTMQMRRAVKNVPNQPRIPLTSSFLGFTQKVLQEQAAQRWADALVRKQKELNQNVKQLQQNMAQERSLKECELTERRAKISELRLELREKKRALEERTLEAKAAMEAATEGQKRRAEEEQRGVTKNMKTNQKLLQVESDTHKMYVEFLHNRIQELDAMGVDWSRKNQTKLKWVEELKLDAEQTRQQCSERLRDCEAEMEVQLTLQTQREEKHQKEVAATVAEEQKRGAAYEAASKLQSAIRAMFTRLALKKLKKGGKKKKKKN